MPTIYNLLEPDNAIVYSLDLILHKPISMARWLAIGFRTQIEAEAVFLADSHFPMKLDMENMIWGILIMIFNTYLHAYNYNDLENLMYSSRNSGATVKNKKLKFFQWKKIHTGKYE